MRVRPKGPCWIIGVVVLLASAALVALADAPPHEDALDRARMEKMLSDGDNGMIVQVFRRYPGRTLPFIDRYLEGGLAMIEKGQDASAGAKALESFRTGIRFAKLADEAFGGTTFSEYANSFASWSPSEQKSFRQGQRAFKEGIKEQDAKLTRAKLEQSNVLARSLGDTWGQAMAHQALAEQALKAGDREQAMRSAQHAIDLNGKLQLLDDLVQSMQIAASAAGGETGLRFLAQAWIVVRDRPDIDPELREKTLKDYLAALENNGQKEQAELIRKEQEKAVEPDTSRAIDAPR